MRPHPTTARLLVAACLVAGCSSDPGTGMSDMMGAGADGGSFQPASHPAWPTLPGSIAKLDPLQIVTVVATGDPLSDSLFQFSDVVTSGQWWQTLASTYGLHAPRASVRVTGPALSGMVSDAQMKQYVMDAVAAAGGPTGDGQTLYLLYLPPGVVALDGSGNPNTDCGLFGGYHNSRFDSSGDGFAMVQRCDKAVEPILPHTTMIASHEIAEAVTDTGPGGYTLGRVPSTSPWTVSIWRSIAGTGDIENADLCEGTRWREGGWTYQRFWSNAAAKAGGDPCVPALAQPFFDVTVAQDWFTVAAGGTIDIPVSGWSTGPVDDWAFGASRVHETVTGWSWMSMSTTHDTSPLERPTINNGRSASLHVVAPAAATSGTFIVLDINAFVVTGDGHYQYTDGDVNHYWPVGIYIQ